MFRGNPTRTYYGEPPVPVDPQVVWRYPADDALCSRSTVAGTTTLWCGTGWTGQPVVYERTDGVTEVIVGAYDKKVHFLDGSTGLPTRPPFVTDDLIKGSVALDPDGFPLIYFGSRDNKLRVVALDRPEPELLWDLDASVVPGIWNSDWDGSPVILDDLLLEGGENSWFFIIKLNRSYDADGQVAVAPERLVEIPGYTDELIARVGSNVSIESSPAVFGNRVYFANSGGRIVGLDLSRVADGEAPIVFDYWVGDDVDATITRPVDQTRSVRCRPFSVGSSGPAERSRRRWHLGNPGPRERSAVRRDASRRTAGRRHRNRAGVVARGDWVSRLVFSCHCR
jgi:hypothetical protein